MSTGQSREHVFIPIIPCRQQQQDNAEPLIPQNLNIGITEIVTCGYLRGIIPRIVDCSNLQNTELYYTGNLCHRLYGVIVSSTQAPQSNVFTTLSKNSYILHTYDSVNKVHILGQPGGQVKVVDVNTGKLELNDNIISNIINTITNRTRYTARPTEQDRLKNCLKNRMLYYVII